jgi:hypothetical protein
MQVDNRSTEHIITDISSNLLENKLLDSEVSQLHITTMTQAIPHSRRKVHNPYVFLKPKQMLVEPALHSKSFNSANTTKTNITLKHQ